MWVFIDGAFQFVTEIEFKPDGSAWLTYTSGHHQHLAGQKVTAAIKERLRVEGAITETGELF